MKKIYSAPEMEVKVFKSEDIINASGLNARILNELNDIEVYDDIL